jgi:hypothetical protein
MGRELREIPGGGVRKYAVERGDQGPQIVEGQAADRQRMISKYSRV